MLTCFIATLFAGINMNQGQEHKELNVEDIRLVRSAVYDNEPKEYSPDGRPEERWLEVPKSLSELYKKKPTAVLNFLLVIMEGANPTDSVLATGYAFELLSGYGRGVTCLEIFDNANYDVICKEWCTTPREHWIRKLRGEMKMPDKKQVGK